MSEPNQPSLDEILAPIHDNGNDGLATCSYQTGRWPVPHTCGLPEAKAQLERLVTEARISGELEGVIWGTGAGSLSTEDVKAFQDRIAQLQANLQDGGKDELSLV